MTVKLTKGIRDDILHKIMKHRFAADEEAVEQQGHALAHKIYLDTFTAEDIKLMSSLPTGWLETDNDFHVQLGSEYVRLVFSEHRRLPADKLRGCWKVYKSNHEFSLEYDTLKDARANLKEAKAVAERQIKAVLESVTTVNKLNEIWPEIAEFTAKYKEAPGKVPMLVPNELNKTLNLPPEEKAA